MECCSVAPVQYSDVEKKVNVPIDLGNNVLLSELPDWVKNENIVVELHPRQKTELLEYTKYALIAKYEAEKLEEIDEEWFPNLKWTKLKTAKEKIALANLSLWISKPSSLRYELVISAQKEYNNWIWKEISHNTSFNPHKNYQHQKMDMSDIENTRKIFAGIKTVKMQGATWVAIYSLITALMERTWEVRYLLFWIALEALFGSDDPREITYRLSQRTSLFLGRNKEEAKGLYPRVKEGYGWRSKVVHGMHLGKLHKEESERILFDTEELVRSSLFRILMDSELISIFSSKERESYLDDLIFR
ncbi:hypothetical protein ES703_66049 [subsurface metagenome]